MAKPKLALIPAAQGTKFYSVLPSDGSGDFTFTRGSVATRINAQGLIENVASGQSRLDYPMIDGVQKGCPHHILEPQRTNLETKSNEFFTWSLNSNITRTADYIISPDGTLNGTRLQFTANGFVANTSQSLATYTMSCYAKRNDSGTQNVGFFTNGSGVVNSAWAVTSEWKRFSYTFPALNGSFMGIAGLSGADISVYGFQIEGLASYPTSYIPTNGESGGVTRSAETATGAGNATTFNDSEGVLMAEISALDNDGTNRYIGLTDGTTSNRINILIDDTNKLIGFVSGSSGIESSADVTNFSKCAFKYKSGSNNFWVNGFKVGSNTDAISLSGLSDISFNTAYPANTASPFYGKTKQLQYFDSALADTQLEQLTSWQSFRDMAEGQLYTIE